MIKFVAIATLCLLGESAAFKLSQDDDALASLADTL
jgi:hypothetical protein